MKVQPKRKTLGSRVQRLFVSAVFVTCLCGPIAFRLVFRSEQGKLIVAQAQKPFPYDSAVVTGASSNHFDVLLGFLSNLEANNPTNIPVIVYSLDLSEKQRQEISERFERTDLKSFNFSAYPPYFDVEIARGEYAWKPVIIHDVLDMYTNVLWLDSGDRLSGPTVLETAFAILKRQGFVTTSTSGTTKTWVHKKSLMYLNATGLDVQMCNGAIIGFSRTNLVVYERVAAPWADCAKIRECIAPHGSSRQNHRQDQAILTVLIHKIGGKCDISEGYWSDGAMVPGPLGIILHQDITTPKASRNKCPREICGGYFDTDQKRVIALQNMCECENGDSLLGSELAFSPGSSLKLLARKLVHLDVDTHSLVSIIVALDQSTRTQRDILRNLFGTATLDWELLIILDGVGDTTFDVLLRAIQQEFITSSCNTLYIVERHAQDSGKLVQPLLQNLMKPKLGYIFTSVDSRYGDLGWNERMTDVLRTETDTTVVCGKLRERPGNVKKKAGAAISRDGPVLWNAHLVRKLNLWSSIELGSEMETCRGTMRAHFRSVDIEIGFDNESALIKN